MPNGVSLLNNTRYNQDNGIDTLVPIGLFQ